VDKTGKETLVKGEALHEWFNMKENRAMEGEREGGNFLTKKGAQQLSRKETRNKVRKEGCQSREESRTEKKLYRSTPLGNERILSGGGGGGEKFVPSNEKNHHTTSGKRALCRQGRLTTREGSKLGATRNTHNKREIIKQYNKGRDHVRSKGTICN